MIRIIQITLVVLLALASPAYAACEIDTVTRQIESQGFQVTKIKRTFLGRIRVEARSSTQEREVVLNRSTCAILRDFREDLDDESDDGGERSGGSLISRGTSGGDDTDDGGDDGEDDGGNGGSGGGNDDDSDDSDGDDDDDDDSDDSDDGDDDDDDN